MTRIARRTRTSRRQAFARSRSCVVGVPGRPRSGPGRGGPRGLSREGRRPLQTAMAPPPPGRRSRAPALPFPGPCGPSPGRGGRRLGGDSIFETSAGGGARPSGLGTRAGGRRSLARSAGWSGRLGPFALVRSRSCAVAVARERPGPRRGEPRRREQLAWGGPWPAPLGGSGGAPRRR